MAKRTVRERMGAITDPPRADGMGAAPIVGDRVRVVGPQAGRESHPRSKYGYVRSVQAGSQVWPWRTLDTRQIAAVELDGEGGKLRNVPVSDLIKA